MEEWRPTTLGEICHFVRGPFGGSLKKSCFVESGYSVYEQQHAIYNQFSEVRYFIDQEKFDEMSRFELLSDDLIMSCSGTMGKVAVVPKGVKPGIINQALLIIRPNQLLSKEFLMYWMESSNFQDELIHLSKGAAIKNVASVKVLKEIQLHLPPLPEQERIVEILDEAIEAIEIAKANSEKNFVNSQEVFEAYLNSIICERGDHTKEMKMFDVCIFENGDRGKNYPSKKVYVSDGVPFVTAGLLNNSELTLKGMNYITEERYNLLGGGKFLPGDLLFCLRGSLGKFGVVGTEVSRGAIASSLVIVRPLLINNTKPMVSSDFLQLYFRSALCKEMISRFAGGTAQPNLGARDLAKFTIFVPDIEMQASICGKLNFFLKNSSNLERLYRSKQELLNELKQSIFHKAFSGELTADKKALDSSLTEAGL